jgi:hypothetical protein
MVEWKKQSHYTVEASHKRLNRVSYEDCNTGTSYRTRPKFSTEKPFVEWFIGTLQRKYLDYHYEPKNAGELREVVDT